MHVSDTFIEGGPTSLLFMRHCPFVRRAGLKLSQPPPPQQQQHPPPCQQQPLPQLSQPPLHILQLARQQVCSAQLPKHIKLCDWHNQTCPNYKLGIGDDVPISTANGFTFFFQSTPNS